MKRKEEKKGLLTRKAQTEGLVLFSRA